jgi:hypothetical protein
MFAHTCEARKGWMPGNMAALDKAAQLSANVTIAPVYAGRVVHLNPSGQFEMGCTGWQMAIFLFQNAYDPDVYQPSDDGSVAIFPDGTMNGFVATGGYELANSEFDNTQTYNYNDPLRGQASNTNAAIGGVLTNQGIVNNTNAVCGVVSLPPAADSHGVNVIQFWPVWHPGTVGN